MKLTINNQDVKLKQSYRGIVFYEQMAGKSFNPVTTFDMLLYFYAIILGSNKDVNITFDEFMDWIDENPEMPLHFANWLIEEGKRTNDFQTANIKQDNLETPESKKK